MFFTHRVNSLMQNIVINFGKDFVECMKAMAASKLGFHCKKL